MKPFTVSFPVRFSETDEMGIVHHTRYIEWFEIARFEILKACGLDYRVLMKDGIGILVTKVACEYLLPAKFNDVISIEAFLQIVKKNRFSFRYKIRREKDYELLAQGESEHVVIKDWKIALDIPEVIKKNFLTLIEGYGWNGTQNGVV